MKSKITLAAMAASTFALAGCASLDPNPGADYVGAPSPAIPAYQQAGAEGIAATFGTTEEVTVTRNTKSIDIQTAGGSTTLELPYRDSISDEAYGVAGTIYAENYDPDTGPSGHIAVALDGQYGTLFGWGQATGGTETINGFGVVGERTPLGAMPSSTASYEGVWISSAAVPGTFAADADFDASSIDYSFTSGSDSGGGAGTISGNEFSGNLTSPLIASGAVEGQFFGPSADEVGGVAQFTTHGGDQYSAGFAGRQVP